MISLYRLSIVLTIGFLMTMLSVFSIWQLNTDIAYSQDDQFEDTYDTSVYNDTVDDDNFDNSQPPNPDPEFMEEIEPGEYNQSDDVTELNDNKD